MTLSLSRFKVELFLQCPRSRLQQGGLPEYVATSTPFRFYPPPVPPNGGASGCMRDVPTGGGGRKIA